MVKRVYLQPDFSRNSPNADSPLRFLSFRNTFADPYNHYVKAMILAAGLGTRLRPLTLTVPKPLSPIAGRPLLTRTIELLARQDIRQIAINLFYGSTVIRHTLDRLGDTGSQVRYSEEERLLGTSGGVGQLREFFDETFVVLYGDNYYHFDLTPLLERHRALSALATIATFTTPDPTACGLVGSDAEGRITRFVEKPPATEVFTDQANAGVYILEPEVFRFIAEGEESDFGRDVFPAMLAALPGSLAAAPLDGYLRDTGTPENYRQANWDAVTLHGERAISPDARLDPVSALVGRNVIGSLCSVEAGATLTETILWDRVTIGRGARVAGAILGNGVVIGAGASVGVGSLLADGARVPEGVALPPGSTLGPGEVATCE